MDEPGSSSGSRIRLAWVSSSHQEVREDEEEVIPDVDAPHGEEGEQGYPGGPRDISLLIYYHDHVARRVWEGQADDKIREPRAEIFYLFKPDYQWFNDVVAGSGLGGLCMTEYITISHGMQGAFMER
ncbi:uncharacterized protein LOC131619167 [Vicia villosa]|uniref:uncharacterized protein LOC131619167 n=1 Tax=Vicia villosa TaxID=3911 RepID=UPI00273B4845|nr:uncharacterized protein LOC131619167 [Vicia villosa]